MTRQFWANLALCLFLGAVVILFIIKSGSALTSKGLFAGDPKPSHDAEEIFDDVELTGFMINKIPGKMVEANFYVQNKSDKNIKNVDILCEFYTENMDYRDQEKWILAETIPAMHELKISNVSRRFVNTTDAQITKCFITDFQLAKKPAFTLDRHVSTGHGKQTDSGHGEKPSAAH